MTEKDGEIKKEDKLLYIQSNLKAPKDQYNDFGKYKYRSLEDILVAVKPLLAETGTTLVFTDEIVLIGDRYYVKATAELKVRGATLDKTFAYAREADSASGQAPPQCTGSASSYARKYCANALFCIDDTKDADSQKRPVSTAATTQPDTTVPPPITITVPDDKPNLRAEIGNMLLEMCNGDTTEAEDMLEYLTTWQNKKGETVKGRRSAKQLSDRQAPVTHRKVTEQYNKWVQTQTGDDGGSSAEDIPLEDADIPW